MYKRNTYKILSNRRISPRALMMVLHGDTRYITRAGQFVNIALEGKYLRRPISVCDYDAETITLAYEVVGDGTEQMSRMQSGEMLDLLTGLGNGFDETAECCKPLLVGGGLGCAPLYNLARRLIASGKEVSVVLGFNTEEDIILADMLAEVGAKVFISTVDGSCGVKGFVTDAIVAAKLDYDYFYACGPMAMLKAVCQKLECDGEVSLDERMACGFGICMCCSVQTVGGSKRICKDGPVFRKNELIWQ